MKKPPLNPRIFIFPSQHSPLRLWDENGSLNSFLCLCRHTSAHSGQERALRRAIHYCPGTQFRFWFGGWDHQPSHTTSTLVIFILLRPYSGFPKNKSWTHLLGIGLTSYQAYIRYLYRKEHRGATANGEERLNDRINNDSSYFPFVFTWMVGTVRINP